MIEDKRALIAVDLGAESCRVSLLRWLHGRACIELIHRFTNRPEVYPDQLGGALRWNLDRILAGVDEGLRQCVAIAEEGVRSIAVDGWAVDYVRLRAGGGAIECPFCYRDPRGHIAFESLHGRIASERLRELTGIQVQPINTVYQLHADTLAGEEQSHWLNLPEYLLYHWGGMPVAERTNATHTGMVALDGTWCEEILQAAGIERRHVPRIVEPGTEVGEYRGAVAGLYGVKLIAPCCHDTACAVMGIPAQGENWAYISSGTWSLVGTVLAQPCNTADAMRENFTNLGAAGGRVLFHKGIPGMWLLKQCMDAWKLHDVALLVERAHAVTGYTQEELLDIEDSSLAAPSDMPARINAQRIQRRLAPIDDAAEMTRLILDSLAIRYAQVLFAIMQITGKNLERIYIVGGGSRNTLLNQLTEQATGLPVIRCSVESSTVGNFAVQLATAEGNPSAANVAQWAVRLSAVSA